ncbi:hypothetical protein ABPG74_006317 [Tetrahymena malaccensis]
MKTTYFFYLLSCLTTFIAQETYKFPIYLSKDDKDDFDMFAKTYSKDMESFNCDNSSKLYIRGGYEQKVEIEKYYDKPYYQVDVSLNFFRIDSWDKGYDYFFIYVNQQECFKQTFTYKNAYFLSKCANSKYDENNSQLQCSVKTNQYPIKIKLQSKLDQDLEDESWGFREFQIQIKLCPSICLQCVSEQECTQCISGYFLKNKNCSKCSEECQECDQDPKKCTKCNKQTFLYKQSCLKECPLGYYQNENKQSCESCISNCSECSAQYTCDICKDGYFKSQKQECVNKCDSNFYGDPNTRECKLECTDSYFANQKTKLCEKCDQSCLTCQESSTKCTSCPPTTYLIKNSDNQFYKCVSQCPEQFYLDSAQKQCLPCYKGCSVCFGPLFNQCTKCKQDFKQIQDKCLRQDCGDYYFTNSDNNVCTQCQKNCIKCSDFNSCDQCAFGNDSSGKCNKKCKDNEFQQGDDCINCNENCLECYGKSETQCLKCLPDMQLQDGKCICIQGYQLNKQCNKCDKTCQDCSYQNGQVQCNSCISNLMDPQKDACVCKEGFNLQDGECKCQENKIFNNNTCLPCHSSCKQCSGPGINECISCKDQNQEINQKTKLCTCKQGYFYVQNNMCQKCYQTCQNCLSSGESDCYSCLEGSNLILVDTRAKTSACKCQSGFYFDMDQHICKKCSDSCKECIRENDCLSCDEDFMYLKKVSGQNFGICVCQGSFFYNKKEKKCQNCHFSCNTCSGISEQECLTCSDQNSELIRNKCICKQGYFLDKFKCLKCSPECQTCNGPQNTDCLSCSSEDNKTLSVLQQSKGICTCEQGYYQNNQQRCIKCYQNCKKCRGVEQNECLDCSEGQDFIKDESGKCVCDEGFYESVGQNNNRICLKCSELCSKCDNQGKCQSCKSQLMQLSKDLSTCECIDNYILHKNQCIQCPNFCKKCIMQKDQLTCVECLDPRTMKISPDKQSCICKQKFYEFLDTCKACSLNCKTCKGASEQDCILCSDENMIKDSQTGICKCQGDLVFDQSTRKCVLSSEKKCKDQKCLKCNQDQCFQCISNYLPKGESCICKDGFYDLEGNQGCQFCQQQGCLVCKTRDTCETCEQGLIKYKDMCFCPDSKYKDDYNKCSLSCPQKCKLCQSLFECSLTKEESNKYDYDYCDLSCGKCSGPSYYDCWNCSSQTRVYDENIRTCQCKQGYIEVFEKDCKEINQIYIQSASIFSITSGSLTFFFMILSLLIDSVFSKSPVNGSSCLFAYSYIQFQQLGNFLFINKVFPLGLEQNFLLNFLHINYFNQIPSSLTPINYSQLQRVLEQVLADDNVKESLQNDINPALFNNPKYSAYKLDTPFIIVSFYPLALSLFAFVMILVLYLLQTRSEKTKKLYLKIKWNLIIIFIFLFSNLCLLSAIINLKSNESYSSANIINIIATSVFCFFYFGGFIYLFFKITFQNILNNNEDYESYSCLHFQICQENLFAKNFWILIELRKIFQIIMIVTEQNALASLISIAFFYLLISLIFIIKKPFTSKSLNIFLIINEITLIIIYMGFSMFASFSRIQLYSAYVIIIAICIFQLCNFFQMLYFLGKTIQHCFNLRNQYIENNQQIQQGLLKACKQPTKELDNKNSLELHKLGNEKNEMEININLSLDQIKQTQIKWNNNPLLSPSKINNKPQQRKTVNLTKRTTNHTQNSQIQNINFKQI